MLTIEDGTGLSNADSYISIADATTYFTNYGGLDAWDILDPSDQEIMLRKSSRDLDLLFGSSYASRPLGSAQSMLWPRIPFTNLNGMQTNGLPKEIGFAVAELALINVSADMTGPSDQSGNLKLSKTTVDVIITQQELFAPTSASANTVRKVSLLLGPYLRGGSAGLYAAIVRG